MITDKQKQRDYEYEADYQSKSRYSAEQWTNILNSGLLDEEAISFLKGIYASFNHAATLLQLSFQSKTSEEDILKKINDIGQILGEANDFSPEVDFNGQEYWWYLLCWGKNTDAGTLEFKLHPELSEAIGSVYPELEESYYAFTSDVERSLQIRYSPEDAVWVAAAVLLYEKYCRQPGITPDDILLMQYEVQTRSQKVYGQDVNTNTITRICNADDHGHRFNYLRDIYKYYRVSYPGEFDGDRERPDPEEFNYDAYIYSVFGYMKLSQLTDFIDHEYAHLVDESYAELTSANTFVRLSAFLTRQGDSSFSEEDTSEQALTVRTDGGECTEAFHKISEALLAEYPNFTYAKKGDWYLPEAGKISASLQDILYIPSYAAFHAFIGVRTVTENDTVSMEISLNLPWVSDEEAMLDIREKCNMLTLMTTAPFQVSVVPAENTDLLPSGNKIKASVLYRYDEYKTMNEENTIGLFATPLQIFASYYTDICQNYYPAVSDGEDTSENPGTDSARPEAIDPLAAALGSKLTYRPASDTPDPKIIYKEGGVSPTTEFVTKALQNYGKAPDEDEKIPETPAEPAVQERETADTSSFVKEEPFPAPPSPAAAASAQKEAPSGLTQAAAAPAQAPVIPVAPAASSAQAAPVPVNAAPAVHADRKDQSFHLYPKNTIIKGPVKTGKYHQAILTAVGIIEGKEPAMMEIEPVPDVLEHYQEYVDEGRILHISYPDVNKDGYQGFIERKNGVYTENGIFKEFANRCADGRYVVMMEEIDCSWPHLLGETTVLLRENRREGASSETAITLPLSKEKFCLPSNLYIVATCDSLVSEDTITEAISHDFFIRPVSPEPEVLHGMRIEGISLQRLMTALNLRISYFLGSEYQLGEGFFLQSPDKDAFISLARVFREQIIPLLEKWFDGDIERIRYVLGDNGKTRQDTVFFQEFGFDERLFQGTLPDSFDRERHIYRCNEDAFYNPKSYMIY